MEKWEDIVGNLYGNWQVVAYFGEKRYGKRKLLTRIYTVECQCVNKTRSNVQRGDLLTGKSTKCRFCRIEACSKFFKNYKPESSKGNFNNNWKGTQDIPHSYYSQIKANAKVRGLEMTISIEYLQDLWTNQKGICPFTGYKLFFKRSKETTGDIFNIGNLASLDRVDPKKGYLEGNVQWVAKIYNMTKMGLSDAQFWKLIQAIYTNRKNK